MSVRHAKGRFDEYIRQPAKLLKTTVRRSQRNKRFAMDIRFNPVATRPRGSRRHPRRPTAAKQVGLLASVGLGDAKFNRVRVFFGGALSLTAILLGFQEARASPMTLTTIEVCLSDTGARMAHLSRVVDGRLYDLWYEWLFVVLTTLVQLSVYWDRP